MRGNVAAKQDLTLTVKAVLARFDGRKYDAMRYCLRIAADYPHLADEYKAIGAGIANKAMEERSARALAAVAGRMS